MDNNVCIIYNTISEYINDNHKYLLNDFIEISINDIDKYYDYEIYMKQPNAFYNDIYNEIINIKSINDTNYGMSESDNYKKYKFNNLDNNKTTNIYYIGYFYTKINNKYLFKTNRVFVDKTKNKYYNHIPSFNFWSLSSYEIDLNYWSSSSYEIDLNYYNKFNFFIHYQNHINKLPQELLTEIKLNPITLFTLKHIEDKMSDESKQFWKNNIYKK
jgi:hypothetical protein